MNRCAIQDAIPESIRRVEFPCRTFRKDLALSQDLQIVSRNTKMFVRVGRDYISRRRIEFRDDFGVDSLRGRNYDITWVNEIQSEFQCIVTNTHLDRSIDLFPINDFHYEVISDFRSKDEGYNSPNIAIYKMSVLERWMRCGIKKYDRRLFIEKISVAIRLVSAYIIKIASLLLSTFLH